MKINKFRQINQNLSRGEVFTPPQLVVKILSKIPKTIYLNKESMFLVPGCGMGVFMIELVKLLVETYGYTIEDAKSRVIGVDNRIKYINYLKRKGYRVYHLDFLKDELPMKEFDVILGNPPYQDSEKGFKGLATLWPKFSKKSIELVKENGYVAFITPPSWMSPGSDLLPYLKKYNLVHVDLDCKSYFNVQSEFSYWILNKNKYNYKTHFVSNQKEFDIDISKLPFIPNLINEISISILKKTLLNDRKKIEIKINSECHSQYSDKVSYEKTELFKYPVHHTNSNTTFSKNPHSNFYLKKVLFPMTGTLKPIYNSGTIGTGQNTAWVEVNSEKESENLIWYLKESSLMNFLTDICKWTGGSTRGIFMDRITKIDLSKKYSDSDLFNEFNLTQEEIDYIENYVG
jgi:hypothetical protein